MCQPGWMGVRNYKRMGTAQQGTWRGADTVHVDKAWLRSPQRGMDQGGLDTRETDRSWTEGMIGLGSAGTDMKNRSMG